VVVYEDLRFKAGTFKADGERCTEGDSEVKESSAPYLDPGKERISSQIRRFMMGVCSG
jgi:hypothetical protein